MPRWTRSVVERLPDHRRSELRSMARATHQLVILAAVVGAVVGLVVTAVEWLVIEVALSSTLRLPLSLAATAPAIGLMVAAAIRRVGGRVTPSTSDEYLRAFHDPGHPLEWRSVLTRLLAAGVTVGSGVPMGLEGPALYTGAVVGEGFRNRFARSLGGADRRTLLVAGAAAGVAAVFRTPATGAVFALEVPYQGDLARRMLIPALVGSTSGYLVFAACRGTSPLFPIDEVAVLAVRDLLGALLLGVAAGGGARLFAAAVRQAKALAADSRPGWVTAVAGVALAAAVLAGQRITGELVLLGPGAEAVRWALQPGHAAGVIVAVLVLRSLATAAAVAGGGAGGLFVPLVAGGALTGAAVAELAQVPEHDMLVVVGIAAFLGAGYRVPLAAVMFVAESTGRPSFVVPGVVAAVASELVMGSSSVTRYQRSSWNDNLPRCEEGGQPVSSDRLGQAHLGSAENPLGPG